MAVPVFLQSQTFSTNTPSTSHALTLVSPVRSQGAAIGPSTLILMLSYDGAVGNRCSGVTDTDSNTWARATSASNSVQTNGEMWVAYNAKGGAAPTITAAMAASVKMTMACVEIDQVRPVTPIDQVTARVDVTNSNGRTSLGMPARSGMIEVFVEGIAWTHATKTVTAGSTYTGLVTLKDPTSNIGVAMARKSAEVKNISGNQGIARFTFSGTADTTPAAIMCVSFFRDGVVTSTNEDGYIDDIEGVANVLIADGFRFVYRSSTSAPNGGTGGSENSKAYSFFPDYSSYLLSGVTIGSTIPLFYNSQSGGNDDGTGMTGAYMDVFKNGQFGSTLDVGDENYPMGVRHNEGTTPCIAGEHQVNLDKATEYNTAGYTTYAMGFEGDTMGGSSATWAYLGDYSGNVPDYLWLPLTYPVLALPTAVADSFSRSGRFKDSTSKRIINSFSGRLLSSKTDRPPMSKRINKTDSDRGRK